MIVAAMQMAGMKVWGASVVGRVGFVPNETASHSIRKNMNGS
jgi:hypothetical protein